MKITKRFKRFCSRLWINKSAIGKLACVITGSAFTVWGFISIFNPLDNTPLNDITFMCKILIGTLVLLAVFMLATITASCIILRSNQICIGESTSKNKVYVKYGDMYSPQIVDDDSNDKRTIVVSVNRCFDTIVDDHLVSNKTQHGKVFQELYDGHQYTPESLSQAIADSLKTNSSFEELTDKEKPQGNQRRYDAGTIVNLPVKKDLSYYLLGFSYFDEHLNAHTSKADFVLAIQKLIEFCNQNAQGYPVILPLLGSGLSRTNIDLKNILHYLTDAFAINKDIINNDFYIVVWEGDKDKIAIRELRQW